MSGNPRTFTSPVVFALQAAPSGRSQKTKEKKKGTRSWAKKTKGCAKHHKHHAQRSQTAFSPCACVLLSVKYDKNEYLAWVVRGSTTFSGRKQSTRVCSLFRLQQQQTASRPRRSVRLASAVRLRTDVRTLCTAAPNTDPARCREIEVGKSPAYTPPKSSGRGLRWQAAIRRDTDTPRVHRHGVQYSVHHAQQQNCFDHVKKSAAAAHQRLYSRHLCSGSVAQRARIPSTILAGHPLSFATTRKHEKKNKKPPSLSQ